jgi:sarcosine oxidase
VSDRYDVLVLGVGGMGAAALAHLAARGVSAIGIEQDDVPSSLGSSTGETRVIRKAYFEDPRYVPLLERSYELWHELEARTNEMLVVRTGCLNVGAPDHPAILGVRESVARHALPHDVLDANAIASRFPAFAPSPHEIGVFEADAGFLHVEACTKAHVRWALASGAALRTQTRVTNLTIDSTETHAIRATLDDGSVILAKRLIVAAGAWLASSPALRVIAASLPLRVERQVQLYFRPHDASLVSPPSLPCFIHFLPDRAYYGIPLHGAPADATVEPALKVCRHHGGETTTASTLDRALRDSDVATVREYLRAHLPSGDGDLLRSRVCMYTNTPDDHFLVGPLPSLPNVILLGGFSGHGYKMAPVLGEIAASLATSQPHPFDLRLFDPSRFL